MATWPGTLPYFERGLRDQVQDGTIRSSMDMGPAKTRQRFTAVSRYLTGTIYLTTKAQRTTFDNFYYTTLSNGADEFDMVDPADGSTETFRFLAPPEYDHQFGEDSTGTKQQRVTLRLERLP